MTSILRAVVLVVLLSGISEAQGSGASSTSPEAELIRANADRTKAEAELRKVDVELRKADAERAKVDRQHTQFFWSWAYNAALAVGAIVLLIWLIPQISEIKLPWGTGAFEIKRAPKEPLEKSQPEAMPEPALAEAREALERSPLAQLAAAPIIDRLEETAIYQRVGVVRDEIYVCHHAHQARGSDNYRLKVYLDAESDDILDKVAKVVYRLHSSFPQRERTQTDRRNRFQLDLTAWGEFMLYANVFFKGEDQSVELKRYLNF